MGLLVAYFVFDGPSIIFFLCHSCYCSPLHVFALPLLLLLSCHTVIGPSSSPGLLRFINSTLLLYMDVHYRDHKLFVKVGFSLFGLTSSLKPYQQLYCLVFNVLIPIWSSSFPYHLYFLGCDCRCPSSRPFARWLGLVYLV